MQAISCSRICASILAVIVLLGALCTATARAQSRLNDRDVEHLMNNLREDVGSFRGPFESALKKSAIRKTTQESDARNLARRFDDESKEMLKTFQKKRKADQSFKTVNATAQQIDPIVRQLDPSSAALPAWGRVQSDLKALSAAFGVATAAPSQPASAEVSCYQAVGQVRSAQLVRECAAVSPATNSPCNAQNSCKLITDEIRRGCALITSNAPSFCAEYR